MTLTRKEANTVKAANLPKWRSLDPVLLLVSLTLSVFGIFAVYVAGTESQQAYATNQALGFVLGVVGAVPLALIDYRLWRRYLKPIYGLVILMLIFVLLLGDRAGGAQRWVDIGPVQVQPSEFAKLGMVIVLAGYFAERAVGEHTVFLRALGVLAIPALLVFVQPDLGTALVFGAIFVAMSYIAGAKVVQLVGLVAAGATAAVLAVKLKVLEEYQVARLTAFMNPEEAGSVGYQVTQSKMAIGSGGLRVRASTPRRLPTWAFCRRSKRTLFSLTSLSVWASWGASCSSRCSSCWSGASCTLRPSPATASGS